MKITSTYEPDELVWMLTSNGHQYIVGKVSRILSWDDGNGFTVEVEYVDNNTETIRYSRVFEDDLYHYDDKESIIEKMFIDNSEMLNSVNDENSSI